MSKIIKKALIIGIGGGADIIGTIPSKIYFENLGIECILGGLPWERYSIDPYPGPRPFEQIINKKIINDSLCWTSKKTRTFDNLIFSEVKTLKYVKNKILLINIFNSSDKIADDINSFCNSKKIDMVIGIDVGGDILANGSESKLASPLADSIMLNVLCKLSKTIVTKIGVLGYGSDGELTQDEINKSLSIILSKKGLFSTIGINRISHKVMKKLINNIETDASRLPIMAYEGKFGPTKIRRGRLEVGVHPMSQITFMLNPFVILKNISKTSKLIYNSEGLLDSSNLLISNGYPSELNYEINKHIKIKEVNNIK